MPLGLVECSYCHRLFTQDNRHNHGNIKLGKRFFCLSECFPEPRTKRIAFYCEQCGKQIYRTPAQVSPHNFCSHSCSAIFFNTFRWGPPKLINILTDKERRRRRLAGSRLGGKNRWLNYQSKYTRDFVLNELRLFKLQHDRVPTKRELNKLYQPTKKHFGSWNKAIEAAGLEPNPVKFAKQHIANDGHHCNSLAEKIIDDYLSEHSIFHERHVSYPEGNYTADFKVGDILIEFFGLAGELKSYDRIVKIKKRLIKKYKLKTIEIYPKDLFPRNKLSLKFRQLFLYKWTF